MALSLVRLQHLSWQYNYFSSNFLYTIITTPNAITAKHARRIALIEEIPVISSLVNDLGELIPAPLVVLTIIAGVVVIINDPAELIPTPLVVVTIPDVYSCF